MNDILGRVVSVSGSQMRAAVTTDQFAEDSIRVGKMIKARSAGCEVVGTISTAEFESHGSGERIVLVADLLGRSFPRPTGRLGSIGAYRTIRSPGLRSAARPPPIWPPYTPGHRSPMSASEPSTMMRRGLPLSWSTSCWQRILLCSAPPVRENPAPLR